MKKNNTPLHTVPNGFREPKMSAKKREEEKRRKYVDEFYNAYVALKEKYNIMHIAVLDYKATGIRPSLRLQRVDEKQEDTEEQRMADGKKFNEEYTDLVLKYKLGYDAVLHADAQIFKATIAIVKQDIDLKKWSDAMLENLETESKCTHEAMPDTDVCKTCGLAKDAWGVDGVGVTEAYAKNITNKIEDLKAKGE